jgi:xanthine dehydrogenase accessory factor
MKELADILNAIKQLPADARAALATVVRVQGSAYRRPGARMLIIAEGHTVGGVSGGCLERDVIQRGMSIMHADQPALVRYDTTLEADGGSGYSLGCGGSIDILIEPLTSASGIQLLQWLKSSQSGRQVIATVISKRHPAIALGRRICVDETDVVSGQIGTKAFSTTITGDAREALEFGRSTFVQYPTPRGMVDVVMEVLQPPLDLLIFGAGSDAVPLVEFSRSLGWTVTVVDVRSAPLDPARVWTADRLVRCPVDQAAQHVTISPSTAAVVMTHNFTHDAQLIRWLSKKPLRYLGLLGPRHRTEQVVAQLSPGAVDLLHSPVGLDIGADNPQEVAMAIVAEITAVLRGRSGLSLRSTQGPIHVGHPHPSAKSCPAAAS